MAVDTKQKRASAIGVRWAWLPILPDADGSVSQADRQDVAFTYTGILSASPVVAAVSKVLHALQFVSTLTVDGFTPTLVSRAFKNVLTARAD